MNILIALDATTEVHREAGTIGNTLQGLVVDDVATLGTVKVYDVQTTDADRFKFLGYL